MNLVGGEPGRFDPGVLSIPGNSETDRSARIEALTVEGECGWITNRTREGGMQVAGALVEQVVYDPTGFGPDRLELLTGVITPAAGDETNLSGKVDITRDGTKRRP